MDLKEDLVDLENEQALEKSVTGRWIVDGNDTKKCETQQNKYKLVHQKYQLSLLALTIWGRRFLKSDGQGEI